MKSNSKRLFILGTLVFIIFAAFCYRLAVIQIKDGSKYVEMTKSVNSKTVTINAARGEILDCFGRKLAANKTTYSVVFDKMYMPDSEVNSTIEKLIRLFEEQDEEWIDKLPITDSEPYAYTDDKDGITSLHSTLKLNYYAIAQNCVDEMMEKYDLKDYPQELARKIMGVRYEMDRKEFSFVTNYTFADDIGEKTVAIIKENSNKLNGVTISVVADREYTTGSVMPHITGVVGPIYAEEYSSLKEKGYKLNDIIGKNGIEKVFEDELKGTDGEEVISESADGEIIDSTVIKQPVNGNTVKLTIDSRLQKETQDILKKWIDYQSKNRLNDTGGDCNAGTAVVVNVKTGAVLAAANYPSYDVNDYLTDYDKLSKAENTPLFDRALNGIYRPGSTFKPAVAIAGLASGTINTGSTVTCKQEYTYYKDHTYTCLGYHGPLSVEGALRESCNIFFYDVGRRVGITALNDYCRQLGLGEPTGLELPNANGILDGYNYRKNNNMVWYIGDVVQCSIGQGENMFSPLQLASYCATIANKGTRYKSYILDSVSNYNSTKTISETEPSVAYNIDDVSESAFDAVWRGMNQVTHAGTGKEVFGKFFVNVSGKTGTSQLGKGSENTLFISFAPYDDPEIAVCVVLEHGGFSRVNCFAAADIYKAYYSYSGEKYSYDNVNTLLK